MNVKLIIAPPAGGKTAYCIERIRNFLREDPFSPVQVITANQLQLLDWKRRLAGDGSGRGSGFLAVKIGSFTKLCMDLLSASEEGLQMIPGTLDTLCIEEALVRTASKKPLDYFSPIMEKPGTLALIGEAIRAFQRGCLTPETVMGACDDPKITDAARVYAVYETMMQTRGWIGASGLISRTAELIEAGKIKPAYTPLLVIDGFETFTADQLCLLKAFSPFCGQILVTLPGGTGESRSVDSRYQREAERVREALGAERADLPSSVGKMIHRQLAGRLLSAEDPDSAPVDPEDELCMIEASSRTVEAREVLRKLKQIIIEDRIKPGRCAVFVPDLHAYMPILKRFGNEMGIPLRFSGKQKMSTVPAADLLKRMLHLYPVFDTSELLAVLRSPFLSGCPDPQDDRDDSYERDLFTVDRVAHKMNVINSEDEWKDAFERVAVISAEKRSKQTEDGEDRKAFEYPPPEKLMRIAESLQRFLVMLKPGYGQASRAEWCGWLSELLDQIRFFSYVTDPDGFSFEDDFRSLLDWMVFCEEKLDRVPIRYEEFLYELESGLDLSDRSEQENVTERVFVGDIMHTAGCRWDAAALMGFSESLFPHAEHEGLILTEKARQDLGLNPLPDQTAALLNAVTRADRFLLISRPAKTDKGEEWPASIYWQSLEALTKARMVISVTAASRVQPASPDELVFQTVRDRDLLPGRFTGEVSKRVNEVFESAGKTYSCLQDREEGRYGPVPDPLLKDVLTDPDRDAVLYSCSGIETFLNCPFRYFLAKKLHLELPEEPGTGMDAAQLGSLNHKILELTFPPGTVYDSVDAALKKASEVMDKALEKAPEDFGFKPSELWLYEKERIRKTLLDTIRAMFRDKKLPMNGHWRSAGTEVPFGYKLEDGRYVEPLEIRTASGDVIRIRGFIDRIDISDDGKLRVVDYKTSTSSGYSKAELEAGSHIQAGIYAAAAVETLKMGFHCDGIYWGINSGDAKPTAVYDADDEAFPGADLISRFAEGIRTAAFPASPSGKSCVSYCPASGWCRRYVREEKYG